MLYIGVGGSAKISVRGAGCSRNQRLRQRNLCWHGGDVLDRTQLPFWARPLLTQEEGR